jgi:hypothetical protein
MSDDTFDAHWLGLRESVDHRSRDAEMTARLAEAGEARAWSRLVDLGGGTGSNVRYLSSRLPWADEWVVVDHDVDLLGKIRPLEGGDVRIVVGDLAVEGIAAARRADVVTASALLDLVSRAWLESLGQALADRACGVLFTLSYDGSVAWGDEDADDRFALEAVNLHQRRDKGLGAALGPDAAPVARAVLEAVGFTCTLASAPWVLTGRRDASLALHLLKGWAEAAKETEPLAASRLDAWATRREASIRSGAYELRVGHLDLLALPRE